MKTYKLELCYDGSRYNGWQRLGNTENTIQGKTETVLSRLLGQSVEISASGRTDAGVHARQQICSFRAGTTLTNEEILHGLRRYLPEDIGAVSLEEAPDRFHARYNCRSKTYVYRVWTSDAPNVFERKYLYFFREDPDIEKMRPAAEILCGEHDFSAFTSDKKLKRSPVREIESIEILRIGGELRMEFKGNGFLYNMVRILAGTLLEVGTGKRSIETIPALLTPGKREDAGFLAPAEGLTLWSVEY